MKEHIFRCLARIKMPKEAYFYICSVYKGKYDRMLKRKQGKLIPPWTLNQFFPGCLSVKLLVHLSFFYPHLKIYTISDPPGYQTEIWWEQYGKRKQENAAQVLSLRAS